MNAPNNQEGITVAGRVAPERQRTTITPNGHPSWPMLLLAGTEKSGKSYEAAKFSGSDLIGRTFWVEIGEGEGHHYGSVPGARYELVPHDGGFLDLLDAVRWAAWQPRGEDGKPNAIVLDSASILWDLVGDEQAVIARQRAAVRAARQKLPAPEPSDYTITSDQWNVAKRRWGMVIDALRHHDGPVIICARMDEVTLFDAAGQPTKDRTWKIQAERKLPFEVTGTVQLRGYRRAFLTGMRSLRLNIDPDATVPYPGFSLDKLMRDLGLHELPTAQRTYVAPRPEAYIEEHAAEVARLAERTSRSRDARRQAAQGQLPDADEVSTAIRTAFEFDGDKRKELVRVRSHYGASVLAQVQVTTPWGLTDANSAIDTALTHVPAPAPAKQSRPSEPKDSRPTEPSQPPPPQQQTPPEQPQPLNPREIEQYLTDALRDPEQGRALLTGLQKQCGPGQLRQTVVKTEWGTMEANSAIKLALLAIDDRLKSTPIEQPPATAAPAAEPTPPPAPAPEASGRPRAQMTAAERSRANSLAEAEFQAQMLGVSSMDFLDELLPEDATSIEQIRGGSRLLDHIKKYRPQVLEALREQGMTAAAEEYAKFGERVPARGINEFIRKVLQPNGR
ncbi:hypothetical protein ACFC07_22080 [Streptomyces sp. NPDC056099]|uniref:hypothetical protein n=1 Tax=unclassified Streptomyces TaxID=2593676 RepID=UPI0035D9D27B